MLKSLDKQAIILCPQKYIGGVGAEVEVGVGVEVGVDFKITSRSGVEVGVELKSIDSASLLTDAM